MCLIVHKDSKIITAKENIVVYKIVYYFDGDEYMSPYLRFKYKRNEKYSISKGLIKSDEGFGFDSLEYNIIESLKIPQTDIRWIHEGYHFAFKEHRLSTALNRNSGSIMIKCIIPKGAKYIVGIDKNLGVSDTIILL